MTLIRKIILTLILLGAFVIAAYLFVWLFLAFLILAPIAYFYFRWRWRKMKQRMKNRGNAVIIEHHHQIN